MLVPFNIDNPFYMKVLGLKISLFYFSKAVSFLFLFQLRNIYLLELLIRKETFVLTTFQFYKFDP